jgi:outer membrane protein
MKYSLIGLMAASLIAPLSATEAAEVSIGIVSMQKVLDDSKKGKEVQKKFEQAVSGEKKEIEKREATIKKAQEDFARDQATMSEEQRIKKQREIKNQVSDLQQFANEAQEKMNAKRVDLLKTVIEPAKEIVNKVAKDKKINIVFERSESGLIYVDDSVDLTPEVVKRLDAGTK